VPPNFVPLQDGDAAETADGGDDEGDGDQGDLDDLGPHVAGSAIGSDDPSVLGEARAGCAACHASKHTLLCFALHP
jgi:hypothetical protein